jgi:amino acid permease
MILFTLARPLARGRPLPSWLERARLRGKPGVPVTAWLVALLLMLLTWLIGDQREILSLFLWLIWIGAPLTAAWVTWLWIAASKEHRAKRTGHRATD